MKSIKIIAYRDMNYNHPLYDSIPFGLLRGNFWYFHGELECDIRYDKGDFIELDPSLLRTTVNSEEIRRGEVISVFDDSEFVDVPYINSAYPVEIDGIDRPCIGYFWTEDKNPILYKGKEYSYWIQRGLIVYKDNLDDMEYARKKYEERPYCL